MGQFIENLQYRFKESSSSILLVSLKLVIGLVLGLTFALIGQEMAGYGLFSFLLVIVVTIGVFYRIARPWRYGAVMVFSLICVLIGLLLKMYILIAPGA